MQKIGTKKLIEESAKALSNQVEPNCKICGDSHWVYPTIDGHIDYSQVIRCICVAEEDRKAKWSNMLRFCRLPDGENTKALSQLKNRGNRLMAETIKLAKDFANGKSEYSWITIQAGVSRGKSHIAKGICYEWIQRGVPALYGFVPDLLDELKNGFDLEGEESYRSKMQLFLDVPLLVLDDLGTEHLTSWGLETIQRIINHRYENKHELFVTTNRPLEEIVGKNTEEQRYASMRIASRLKREKWCKIIHLDIPPYEHAKEA